jgi:hypothetical protein
LANPTNFGWVITFHLNNERAKDATIGPAVNKTIPITVGTTSNMPIRASLACRLAMLFFWTSPALEA